MPNYTFTTSSTYALSTHEVSFTSEKITIKLTSTGETVYTKTYDSGLAFKCSGNDFCVGTLNDNGTFSNTVSYRSYPKAAMWLDENSGANAFIGSNDESDPGIYHKYDLNQCPVRLSESSDVVTIECPCQSSSGGCDNDCYTYGD